MYFPFFIYKGGVSGEPTVPLNDDNRDKVIKNVSKKVTVDRTGEPV
jgi:hypothetical protein